MKKLVFILSVLFLMTGAADVQAQWLKKVGQKAVERAKERAKNKVERKVDDAVDKTVDGAFDGAEDAVKGKDKKEKTNDSTEDADGQVATQEGGQQQQKGQSLEMTYAKSDFVPGDEIIFDDNLASEQVGEFPSKWNLERGNAEVAMINGEKVLCLIGNDSWISPLMKEPKNYLSDVFTLEFDIMCPTDNADGNFELDFMQPSAGRDDDTYTVSWSWSSYDYPLNYFWTNTNDERSSGEGPRYLFPDGKWHHVALSFNKRALKVYYDGKRVANVPNVKAGAGWVTWWTGHGTEGKDKYMKNIRIAKGAVPLYDRMMSEGKFITYGITFDVGKSTIKPESMGEINRIVKLMTDNPGLKFSVEGHTDSTGNATTNQTLSEARSKAIVDKLVELGIAADRLTSSGKGQTTPIADNGTDEGRAKNRRVEFVKI